MRLSAPMPFGKCSSQLPLPASAARVHVCIMGSFVFPRCACCPDRRKLIQPSPQYGYGHGDKMGKSLPCLQKRAAMKVGLVINRISELMDSLSCAFPLNNQLGGDLLSLKLLIA